MQFFNLCDIKYSFQNNYNKVGFQNCSNKIGIQFYGKIKISECETSLYFLLFFIKAFPVKLYKFYLTFLPLFLLPEIMLFSVLISTLLQRYTFKLIPLPPASRKVYTELHTILKYFFPKLFPNKNLFSMYSQLAVSRFLFYYCIFTGVFFFLKCVYFNFKIIRLLYIRGEKTKIVSKMVKVFFTVHFEVRPNLSPK